MCCTCCKYLSACVHLANDCAHVCAAAVFLPPVPASMHLRVPVQCSFPAANSTRAPPAASWPQERVTLEIVIFTDVIRHTNESLQGRIYVLALSRSLRGPRTSSAADESDCSLDALRWLDLCASYDAHPNFSTRILRQHGVLVFSNSTCVPLDASWPQERTTLEIVRFIDMI